MLLLSNPNISQYNELGIRNETLGDGEMSCLVLTCQSACLTCHSFLQEISGSSWSSFVRKLLWFMISMRQRKHLETRFHDPGQEKKCGNVKKTKYFSRLVVNIFCDRRGGTKTVFDTWHAATPPGWAWWVNTECEHPSNWGNRYFNF